MEQTNETNVTNSTDHSVEERYNNFEIVLLSIVFLVIIAGTIVGNILVCVAVCLVRKLRRPCNYLLVSLAISDLCVAILVMPLAALGELGDEWLFGDIVCNLWVSFDVLSCTASILNLCMISVDRYYAITKPLEYGVKRTPKRMILCVILVWFSAACISLPPLLILGNEHVDEHSKKICLVSQNVGYQVYATLCSFYIPLGVMMLVYYKIFQAARNIVREEKRAQSHLESHRYVEITVKNGDGPPENKISNQTPSPANPPRVNNHRSSSSSTNTMCSQEKTTIGNCFQTRRSNESQCPMLKPPPVAQPNIKLKQKKSQKSGLSKGSPHTHNSHKTDKKLRFQLAKERKASTTLGIIMSAFTICWLPFFVLAIIRPMYYFHVPDVVTSFLQWLGYANSLLNPIIYATLNRDFRKPFQEILYFRCGRLNHMMREDFYHSQYGNPEPTTRFHMDDEGVEIIEAEGEDIKVPQVDTAHESFL